jgi:hypothetical protein
MEIKLFSKKAVNLVMDDSALKGTILSKTSKEGRTPSMGLMTSTMLPSFIGSLVCL